MHLKFRNVNDAFREIVTSVCSGPIPTRRSTSRAGDVIVVDEPLIVTYARPLERVLLNAARDMNPFFAFSRVG